MISRELVKRTLEFESPTRVPRELWLLPWAEENHPEQLSRIQSEYPDDIVRSPLFYKEPPRTVGNQYALGTYIDEWGCLFENRQSGVIGQVKEPLVKQWAELDKVRIPTELLSLDVEQINAFCRHTDKFVVAGRFVRPFERLQFIRRTDNLFMDLAEQPDELFVLIDRIHQFYLKELELWAKTGVDALFFMDDWGAQGALLVSPDLWRKIFKPLYKSYIALAHEHGKYIFMHSDGYIIEIIPDLIEIDLDALNSQIFCMGVEELGRRFRGRITWWGEIDRQYLLARASVDEVADAVRKVRACLYQEGGVIAQCEFGPGAKPQNVRAVFETWDSLSDQLPGGPCTRL